MKNKIPLKNAVIAWTGKKDLRGNTQWLHVYHEDENIPDGYIYTSGAAFTNWKHLSGRDRYQCLLQEGWMLMLKYGFDINQIHSAFFEIKEYAFANEEEEA